MIKILPVNKKVVKRINQFGLNRKWEKQIGLLQDNLQHPSLNLELMSPKNMGVYSFRIDKKFRGLMFFRDFKTIEILNITVHYH